MLVLVAVVVVAAQLPTGPHWTRPVVPVAVVAQFTVMEFWIESVR
jgi:hypothetical protein